MEVDKLAALVGRLEKVTVTLEDVSSRAAVAAGGGPSHAVAGGGGRGVQTPEFSPSLKEYNSTVAPALDYFCLLSNKISGSLAHQAELVKKAFVAHFNFLLLASTSKQPTDEQLGKLLKPISAVIAEIQAYCGDMRQDVCYNHLSAVSESIGAIGWLTMAPTPAPYIKEMSDSAMFYTNRVLKEYKGKDDNHVEWTKAWLQLLSKLQSFVKNNHTTGLVWNPQGGDPMTSSAAAAATSPPPPPPPPPPPAGGPPAPPPPPPPADGPSTSTSASGGRAALFQEISQGADITKGLKKVADDQKTHKNPALRHGPTPFKPQVGPKPFKTRGAAPTAPAPAAPVTKPPVMELQGKKWLIEYQKGSQLTIDDTNKKQTVYLFKCEGTTVVVKGKVNSITVDNCKKTAVVFDDCISMVEFVNCQSVQGQVLGNVPTVSIEKTDGCLFYLSPSSSKSAEIVTAKSSEMNIVVPPSDDDPNADSSEHPLPEQFKSRWDGKKFVTTVSDIAG